MSARSPRPSARGVQEIADLAARVRVFDPGPLLRAHEVVTPAAEIERAVKSINRAIGLNRPAMTQMFFGIPGPERSLLTTALGTSATASALKAAQLANVSVSEQLSKQLATIAGVNARVDLGQSAALSVGLRATDFQRLAEGLTGNVTGLSENMKTLLALGVFGTPGRKRFDRWISGFQPHLQRLYGFVERLNQERERLAAGSFTFVERYGWPLPLVLPPSTLGKLVRLMGRTKPEVRKAMVEAFAPRSQAFLYSRDALLESDPFKPRKRPIEQAVRALRREDHYAAICTMLPLIEGVLMEVAFGVTSPPKQTGKKRESAVKQALDKLAPPGSAEEDWALRMIEAVLLCGAGGVALFSQFDRKDYGVPGESRRLNRHAILHGSARRYGTQENSLKLFLLLVAMAEALEQS